MRDESETIRMSTGEGENLSGRAGKNIPQKRNNIKIGRHGAEMIMTSDPQKNERMLARVGVPSGEPIPASQEERIKLVQNLIANSMGVNLTERNIPSRIGFDISTDSQRKLLFGILKLMTQTDYQGNYQVPNSQIIKNPNRVVKHYNSDKTPDVTVIDTLTKGVNVSTGTHIGGAYENIPLTPVIKITKNNLMKESGFDPDSGSDVRDFDNALSSLALDQHFLMWTRFARDEKGDVKIDRRGRTEFELVSTFSPVLNVFAIADPEKKVLQYYEISPAPVFLDEISREYGGERGGYFLLIPENFYQDVSDVYKKRYPSRKGFTPSVIQALCFWLRLKVQDIQNRERNPFTKKRGTSALTISYFDLCRELDFGEETIKKNRRRISKTLDEGISIAVELGYLKDYHLDLMTGDYVFELNLDYYPNQYKQATDGPENKNPPSENML